MATIHDVAREAAVSAATVSRVLNGGVVSPRTKSRILAIIDRLGYVPDERATSLRRASTRKIGLIVSDIDNPIYPKTVKTIHDLLKRKGYPLILGCSYGSNDEEADAIEMMRRERVSGIIVSTPEGEDDICLKPLFERLVAQNMPFVFLGKTNWGLPIDTVLMNDQAGMRELTSHVIDSGKVRIAFLSGGEAPTVTQERFQGFFNAMRSRSMQVHHDFVIRLGAYSIENGYEQASKLLSLKTRPDAIVCANDLLAIGALRAAEDKEVRVPAELAITGFDDIYLATLVRPQLTTIHQPVELTAEKACEFLFHRIENAGRRIKASRLLIDPQLIIRGST